MTTAKQNISIRSSTGADAPVLARLVSRMGYPSSSEEMEDRLARIEEGRHLKVFVAVDAETVIGAICVMVYPSLVSDMPFGHIMFLVVDELWRRRGVGRDLVSAATDWLRTQNAQGVIVHSRDHRPEAHIFYERQGFMNNGRRFFRWLIKR